MLKKKRELILAIVCGVSIVANGFLGYGYYKRGNNLKHDSRPVSMEKSYRKSIDALRFNIGEDKFALMTIQDKTGEFSIYKINSKETKEKMDRNLIGSVKRDIVMGEDGKPTRNGLTNILEGFGYNYYVDYVSKKVGKQVDTKNHKVEESIKEEEGAINISYKSDLYKKVVLSFIPKGNNVFDVNIKEL